MIIATYFLETTQISINRIMGKWTVAYSNNGTPYSKGNEQTTATWGDTDESQKYCKLKPSTPHPELGYWELTP